MTEINPREIYASVVEEVEALLRRNDYEGILRIYDNKGLLAEAAKVLDLRGKQALEELIGRILGGEEHGGLFHTLRNELPDILLPPRNQRSAA